MLDRVSTLNLRNGVMGSVRSLQSRLSEAQLELSTGRHADVGLELGANVERNLDWRGQIAKIEARMQRNIRFDEQARVVQASVESMKKTTDSLMQTLIGARGALNGKELTRVASENTRGTMMDSISVSYAGVFIFSGKNPDTTPIADYKGGPAQAAFDAAFQAEFGFAKTDPQSEFITTPQMQAFIDGAFADLFTDPNWSSTWSNVTAENIELRIDAFTTVDVSANANEQPFKDAMKAITLVYEMAGTDLASPVFQTVIDKALATLATATQGYGDIQSRIGFGQQAIDRNKERLLSQKSLLETAVTETESVSEYDAATRVNSLMAQLEASYTVTGRISRLSLLNYL